MNHDNNVGSGGERETVTGLLIRTIAAILRMHLDLHAVQRAGDRHRSILTCIVHHNHEIDDAMRHYLVVVWRKVRAAL